MREIKVDRVDLQASQRVVSGGLDSRRGEPLVRRPLRHLGRDHHLVALAALGEPVADDRFRLTALVAGYPGRIRIGGVDQVQAGIDERIEHGERGRLVDVPAKHVAAECERLDFDAGPAELALAHRMMFRWKSPDLRANGAIQRAALRLDCCSGIAADVVDAGSTAHLSARPQRAASRVFKLR